MRKRRQGRRQLDQVPMVLSNHVIAKKQETKWLCLYTVAAITSIAGICFNAYLSGYLSEASLDSLFYSILLFSTVSFSLILFKKTVGVTLLGESDVNNFDIKDEEGNNLLRYFLSRKSVSCDSDKRIYFFSLNSSIVVFNAITITLFLYTLAWILTFSTSYTSIYGFVLLIFESLVIYITISTSVKILFQIPAIIRYQKLINKKYSIQNKKEEEKFEVNIEDELYNRIINVIKILTPSTGASYIALYELSKNIKSEIDNTSIDFNLPDNFFKEELILINEIITVFFPSTLDSFEKAFNNTSMRSELTIIFRSKVENNIFAKIKRYEAALSTIRIRLIDIRLTPFNTSVIDEYITDIHRLNKKIQVGSGSIVNKHTVIAQNIISDLLPSLVKTWSLSTSQVDKDRVEDQFKKVVEFLETQLSAVEGSNKSDADPLLLSIDSGININSGELQQKIGVNGKHIELLIKNWN